MAIIPLLSAALAMFIFSTGIANCNSSRNDVDDSGSFSASGSTSKIEKRGKRSLDQTIGAAIQGSSVNDDQEIETEANRDELSNLSKYTGTKFGMLCSGETLLPAVIQKELKCRYVDHGIPFLKIGPLKEEEAYLKPRIVLYHDVIYEEEIEVLKILSEGRLESATIAKENGGFEFSNDRIAKSVWLDDFESRSLKLLSRRVEYMTGLTTKTAEDLQISYYDIGGLYEEHLDSFPESFTSFFEESSEGNRIATILFYMNDVEKGGATVFTELNITIRPQKGSALFWNNLKRNGRQDELTEHGACPVLSGTKWIATRWLYEKGQELRRPCALLENE